MICVISQEGRLKTYNRAVINVSTCIVFVSTFLRIMLCCILLYVSYNKLGFEKNIK
jgi:hypothetical protein